MRAGRTMPNETTTLISGPFGGEGVTIAEPRPSTSTPDPSAGLPAGILERNLLLLSLRNATLARELGVATPTPDLWTEPTPEGPLGGGLRGEDALAAILGTSSATGVQLASLHRPLEEAKALVETVDVVNNATAVVLGFGLGHHVRVLSERLKEQGLVVVFEPDLGLLRAMMERIDMTQWLVRANVVFVTREDDSPAIAEATRGFETMLTLGTQLVAHPPSAARLGERSKVFVDTFMGVLKAARTHIVTSLVQTEITLRNLLQNLDHYTGSPGIEDLKDRCLGKPAIVVSAGPSLARTIDQLAAPGVRDRFVIVAAQTVLKPLLARGIKPHFVTALDHHEISRRFYEGLTPADVEGVTLIAEAKANAAILGSFPGLIRCCADEVLDRVLGPQFARTRGKLPPGATVAHLAYYVARHLGCDPVIMTGQDLGFTDGQYYAAGATIHNVWGCELNEFNTLEMMEWERIARMKSTLRKVADQLGRPIYTDEQMHTYLVQFERDFARDEASGLTTIDATEGGVAKRHTIIRTMMESLAAHHAPRGLEPDPLQPTRPTRLDAKTSGNIVARLRSIQGDVTKLGERSRQTAGLLKAMLDAKGDQRAIAGLIKKVYDHRDQVQKLETANWLVHFLNQCGTFRRLRADRAIALAENLAPLEVQARQIERDISNVEWLADAANQAGQLLTDAMRALTDHVKVTRDNPGREEDIDADRKAETKKRVLATVLADPTHSALGVARELSAEVAPGVTILRATLDRLALCRELDGIVVVTLDIDTCKRMVGRWNVKTPLDFAAVDAGALREHQRSMLAGRAWSRHAWRGGVASLTCFDEVCPAALLVPILRERGADAACVVGGDWTGIDPSIADETIGRYRESPSRHRLTFSQAVPGAAPAVLATDLIEELVPAKHQFATIGGLLRYVPIAPQADAISRPVCVNVPPALRDAGKRAMVESASRQPGPDVVRVEVTSDFGTALTLGHAHALAQALAEVPGVALTLEAHRGVPHAHLLDIVRAFRHAGVQAIHVRATLDWPVETLKAVIDAGAIVLSVDVTNPRGSLESLDALKQHVAAKVSEGTSPALPTRWIVPRLTRRDEVYETIEGFYDACIMAIGACVIDPLPEARPGERIQPLPLPASARARARATELALSVNGEWSTSDGEALGNIERVSLSRAWAHANRPSKHGASA